jgi:tRNA(Ile)-lysidine synthase
VEYVDCDKLQKPLRLRSWREGDWFVPFGMNEPKKMSDFFIDHKIPLLEKITIPLFTASEDIVWVCGLRLDDRYKITSATTKYIKLEYRMHE